MTTIAAKIEDNIIQIGADSRTSLGTVKVDQTLDRSKIFEGSDMIIASTGLTSEASLIQLFAKDHSIGNGGELRVLEWLLEFSGWKKDKTGDAKVSNRFIIAHKSGLYTTDGLSIERAKDYTSTGSGWPFCFTALHLGKSLKESLEVSCELDAFTEGPVIIKTMELE